MRALKMKMNELPSADSFRLFVPTHLRLFVSVSREPSLMYLHFSVTRTDVILTRSSCWLTLAIARDLLD